MISSVTVCSTWMRGQQELHRARFDVTDLLGEGDRVRAHRVPDGWIEVGRRSDLDDLLVAPLQRAVPLEQVDRLTGSIGEDLDLDVPRVHHGFLDEDRGIAEGRLGLAHGGGDRLPQVFSLLDAPHTAAATASNRLDEHREADLIGARHQGIHIGRRGHPTQGGQTRSPGRGNRPRLVARQVQDRSRWAHEGDAGVLAGLGEVGVLGEEAIAGIDRVGSRLQRDPDNLSRVEVGAHRVALVADLVGLIGADPVLGVAVFVREDRDGLGVELGGGTERADGDFTTVGDQDFSEHRDLPGRGRKGRAEWCRRRAQPNEVGHLCACSADRRDGQKCRRPSRCGPPDPVCG